MKRQLLILAVALAALAVPPGARGQAQVKITNQHSAGGAPPQSATTTGASAGQFRSAAATNGGRNTATTAGSTTPVAVPTNGTLKLWRSMAGASFALGVPDFAFGERITPPVDVQPLAFWRAAPVAPGEIVKVSGQPVDYTPVPAGTVLHYYYSQHSGVVYASESGNVDVTWRSALADGSGNFTVLKRSYVISIVPAVRPYRMFWTGAPQFGPIVPVPAGVDDAYIAYTDRFPPSIGPTEIGPNGEHFPENRTFWLDNSTVQKSFRAERVEGRILLELLGAELDAATGRREALGVRVVDVFSEPLPSATAFTETTFLGDQLLPSATGAPDAALREALLPDVRAGLSASPAPIAFRPINERASYWAERVTGNPDEVVIMWKELDERGIQWPYMQNNYNLVWPENSEAFALNALTGGSTAASIDLFSTNMPTLVFQDATGEASINQGRFSVVPGGDGTNRSLVLFQVNGRFWYQRIFSANSNLFGTDGSGNPLIAGLPSGVTVSIAATVNVGERIEAPDLTITNRPADNDKPLSRAGSILTSQGTAYHTGAYVDPLGPAGFPAAELRSEIIPVNALAGNNHLTVWWYRKIRGPSADFQPVHFPSIVGTYTLQWPAVAPATPANRGAELVIARNNGTGELTPAQSQGSIYYQNDPEAHGYNPNEEHARMIAGRAYALRDDLNLPTSSDPRVLISYTHPDDNRPAMRVFKVLRERILDPSDPTNPDKNLLFNYPATAGKILQSPAPLPIMPPPLENRINKNREVPGIPDPDAGNGTPSYYDTFIWEDRKHSQWVYRGPHAGATPTFKMEYYYVSEPGFAYPGNPTPPPVGSIQPFLRASNGAGGYLTTPQQVTFRPVWPDVPVLEFGQTLTAPINGLPDIRNNTSLEVFYEQSRARDTAGTRTSIRLFDPTRAKTYAMNSLAGGQRLDKLPGSLATDSRNGKTYFQKLPPHLKERFFFNPNLGANGMLVLEGRFVDEIVGEKYLLLNVLSGPDLAAIKGLVPFSDPNKTAWDAVVQNLVTTVQTAEEDPNSPGYYFAGPPTGDSQNYLSDALPEVTNDDQPVDSYALTTAGTGEGYVVLVAGNGLAPRTPEAEPVALHVIRVAAPLHTGQLKVLASTNPLDEKVTLRHSSDFAGRPQDYDFEWSYSPPVNGRAPSTEPPPGQPGTAWFSLNTPGLINTHVVEGASIQTISDNYWIMRYRPKVAPHPQLNVWSEWTQPALVEGWIKRALAGINPFSQRVTDFFNNSVNTDVSILTQAGRRWEGNIALNLANINEFGLIEIYETILNRGMDLSINGIPPLDYGPANDALLLASGYLADLYSILGEEAAADAANPTIAFDAQSIGSVADSSVATDFTAVFNQTSTARFAFQGQVRNLLEEELGLLLGRDDVNSPGVELSPSYNRLYWNYTRGINAGEVIYALNYNIRERQEDSSDGKIDAADAYRMFPQGHGDAYGHYLTAVTNYYRLLTHPQFTWGPRIEAVNVLGVPVQVDYLDERKFSSASARVATTARQITGLIHRQSYTADKSQGWRHLRDGSDPTRNYRDGKQTSAKRTRHWGLDEWAARGTQGAYFNWVVANAILPASSTATGIEKIDRTTVPELDEIALAADQLQQAADNANTWLNPLGLSADSTLFDISPAELTAGKTHFEQIYERATRALGNAFDTFDQATASTRLLRSLENQADDLSTAVYDQERAFNLQLIDIYGTPYEGDKGPGKAYVQGYDGADLFRWFYIDRVTQFSDPFDVSGDSDVAGGTGGDGAVTYELNVDTYDARQFLPDNPDETDGVAQPEHSSTISYVIRPDSHVQYATPEMGRRLHPGRLQLALQDLNAKREDMAAILDFYNRNGAIFETELRIFNESIEAYKKRQDISAKTRDAIAGMQAAIANLHLSSTLARATYDGLELIVEAAVQYFPDSVGSANDATSTPTGHIRAAHAVLAAAVTASAVLAESAAELIELGVSFEENDLERKLEEAGFPAEYLRMAADVQAAWYDWLALGSNIDQAALALQRSRMELAALMDEGEAIKRSREIFRKRAAAITQGYRTRDVAFRTFRTEALEQYQTLLDWATRYTCLAAKAYDYETGLLGTPQGQSFISDIVGSRALGLRNASGQPIFAASSTGDPGLSGLLAKLNGDWSSVRTRLGFNNPDIFGTVFSLRQELYRIPGDTAPTDSDTDANNDSQNDKTWKEQMQSLIVSDLRNDADVATHCLQLSGAATPVPGFIIPFSTTVEDGVNFFGKPLAGGDSTFTSTSFATKIHSVGIAFDGYVGMNNYAPGSPVAPGPASNAPNSLSATPYVFLIPTGQDMMRTPPLGDTSVIRSYNVQDYALPLPFNIGASEFSNVQFWTGNDTLTEDFLTPRKHQAFRAVDSPVYFFMPLSADFTNRRLVGRSVWNTGWKLVIPANTLLNSTSEGLTRFLKSVRDIKLYVRSYSYSGN